jgi:DNA-binding GntR family transcriptional regulator
VVDRLRTGIVRGNFEPGQHLTEAMLAEAFGVSRGPVREALARLAREGLVVFHRHKGATIARLSREELEQIYELRLALERLAMERAVRLATDEDLAAMDLVVSSLERSGRDRIDEVLELDLRFHDLIYRAARHPRLYDSWSNIRSQVHAFLFSRTSAANVNYLDLVAAEHAEAPRRHKSS